MTYRSITGKFAKPNYYSIDITKMLSKKPAVYQSKFDAKGQKAMAILIDRIRKNVPFDTSIEGANEVYQDLIKSFTRTPNEKGEYLYEDDAYEAPLKSLALRQSTLVDIAEAVRAGFDKVCGALTAPQVKNIKIYNIQAENEQFYKLCEKVNKLKADLIEFIDNLAEKENKVIETEDKVILRLDEDENKVYDKAIKALSKAETLKIKTIDDMEKHKVKNQETAKKHGVGSAYRILHEPLEPLTPECYKEFFPDYQLYEE